MDRHVVIRRRVSLFGPYPTGTWTVPVHSSFELYGLEFGATPWVDNSGTPWAGRWVCTELSTGTRVDLGCGWATSPEEAIARGLVLVTARGEAKVKETKARMDGLIALGRYV